MQKFYTLNLNTYNILIYCQLIDREYICTITLFTNDFVQRNLPIKNQNDKVFNSNYIKNHFFFHLALYKFLMLRKGSMMFYFIWSIYLDNLLYLD